MKEIQLHDGAVAKVDDEDVGRLGGLKWMHYPHRQTAYARTGQNTMMHRFILGLVPGDGKIVDHLNGDGLDNRKANLRIVTAAQNSAKRRLNRTSTSGFKGVSLIKATGRWQAYIKRGGQLRILGRFTTKEAAARAYNRAAVEAFGEFALLNPVN